MSRNFLTLRVSEAKIPLETLKARSGIIVSVIELDIASQEFCCSY